FFLGYFTVNNSEGPKFHRTVDVRTVTGRHEYVVGARLLGQRDVGSGRVCLGCRVRVVDDDGLLTVVVHLAVELQQVRRVELVEGRRASGIQHRDEAHRSVTSLWPRDDTAGFVGMVTPCVRDDGVVHVLTDPQHRSRVEAGRTTTVRDTHLPAS